MVITSTNNGGLDFSDIMILMELLLYIILALIPLVTIWRLKRKCDKACSAFGWYISIGFLYLIVFSFQNGRFSEALV